MNSNFEIFLFRISFIFIIFDSFPIPIDFVYRPLSIFPLAILALNRLKFLFLKNKVHLPKKIFYFFLIILFISIYQSVINYKNLSGLIKFILEIIVIIIIYNGFMRGFELSINKKGIKSNLRSSFKLVIYALILIGTTQLLFRFLNLENLTNTLNSLFTYRYNASRIQFFSGEPSMGVRTIVFFISMYTFILEKKVPYLVWFLVLFLIFFSGSTFGILFIVLFGFFYSILKSSLKTILINLLFFILTVIIIYFLLPLLLNYLSPYAQNKINLVYRLISSLDSENLLLIAERDGSFFLRIFNPIIGFLVFLNNLFGVGGENFKFEYIATINEYFPFALNHNTVQKVLFEGSEITPKSLIFKMLAEFGLFGFWIILFTFNRLRKIIKDNSDLFLLFIFILTLSINYGSYIYIPLIFTLSLFYFINKKNYPKTK